MAIQYSKVVCSILLSLLAVILFLRNRRKERKLCMVAMILSGIGDIFMTDVLKLGSAGTVPGAAFFMKSKFERSKPHENERRTERP